MDHALPVRQPISKGPTDAQGTPVVWQKANNLGPVLDYRYLHILAMPAKDDRELRGKERISQADVRAL
jgi:hypothetical protein